MRKPDMSIDELRELLARRLSQRLNAIKSELKSVNAEIARLSGSRRTAIAAKPVARTGRRTRQRRRRRKAGVTLRDAIFQTLQKSSKPLSVSELAEAALALGHKSKSKNLKNVLRQVVYRDPQIRKVGTGKFRLKSTS